MIVAVIGKGPNDIEIIGMLFETYEQATTKLTEIFGRVPDIVSQNNSLTERYYSESGFSIWSVSESEEYKLSAIFSRYDGGCGACYEVSVEVVEFGKPLVAWDLD